MQTSTPVAQTDIAKAIAELVAHKEAAAQLVKDLDDKIWALKARTVVTCEGNVRQSGCGSDFQVCELEYIQTHEYEPPHGCSGGDYWRPSEGRWRCPDCSALNRLYNKPEIVGLKRVFKSVREEHSHRFW